MTKIEDMSETERQSWITLLADTAVFAYFIRKTTDGFDVIAHSPESLLRIYVTLIIMTIVIHVIIASFFAMREKRDSVDIDERDRAIDQKGDRNGFWVVCIAINVIIFTLLFEYAFPNPEQYDPPISVIEPPHMFFALMATMFVADIVKRATMIMAYRD